MGNLYELFPTWLERFDQGLRLIVGQLSASAGPEGLLAYLPALLLVLFSRQPLHVLVVLAFELLALAAFRLDDPAVGLVIYVASISTAAHGFVARRQRRRADQIAEQLVRLQHEITTFLDGLDRRSQDADRMRSTVVHPQKERQPEHEPAQ